jgi:hypothetical protein
MKRKAKRGIVFIIAAFTAWTSADPCIAAVQPDRPIPAELKHVAPFVEFLRGAGLIVLEVQQSHLTGMFKGTDQAAYITTNRGVLELVTFPGPTDAERITIEYSKTPGVPASHHYLFQGWPINGDAGKWSGTQPAYFTLHKNWFIVAWQPELDAFVKRRLGQTSRPDLLR